MKVKFISPIGAESPYLFSTFIKTLEENGHTITNDVNEATVVFFDSHSGYLPYDIKVLNTVIEKQIPIVWYDAFDYHSNSAENWFGLNNWKELEELSFRHDWANFLWLAIQQKQKLVYFMRKMQTNCDYGSFVYPLELIMYPDHVFEPVSKEELFNRPNDICFIGNTSPVRANVCNELKKHFKCDFRIGEERIPHDWWLERHRSAKLFLCADGGGLNDERAYQLMFISPMLKQRNQQLVVNDFKDAVDCIKVGDYWGNVNRFDIEDLQVILSEPDTLYSIYINGIEHMKKYYNETYRTNYILSILKQNDLC